MKLLIISNMAHHRVNGVVVGHGATARELHYLAQLFDEVRHVACLHDDAPSPSELPYDDPRITLVGLPPAGGPRFWDKLGILRHSLTYLRSILHELPQADVVHVRCPANIPLLALLALALVRHPRRRWIKYAGNWEHYPTEARSYAWQRWWLRRNFSRAWVTVNGEWPPMPPHIRAFYNPCLTDEEVAAGAAAAHSKTWSQPLRLLFVGNLNAAKGVGRLLQIAQVLRERGAAFTLQLIGEGAQRPQFEAQARELGVTDVVQFVGSLPRPALNAYYAQAHFILLPTNGEGWPKVLSEAMACGVVPLAAHVSSIPQMLARFQSGQALPVAGIHDYAETLLAYDAERWQRESRAALKAAPYFTYSYYQQAVRELLAL